MIAQTPVGHLPYGVAMWRDGRRAFVSSWGANTVTVLDATSAAVTRTLEVGTHPRALHPSPTRDELYVAASDSDEVTVIDSAAARVSRRISLAPWWGAPTGAGPNTIASSPDGRSLYVANAGDNDVAVVRLAGPHGRDHIAGLIPTGWFPAGIAIDRAGHTLHVINMKRLGVGPVQEGGYIADQLQGTLSSIRVPDDREL